MTYDVHTFPFHSQRAPRWYLDFLHQRHLNRGIPINARILSNSNQRPFHLFPISYILTRLPDKVNVDLCSFDMKIDRCIVIDLCMRQGCLLPVFLLQRVSLADGLLLHHMVFYSAYTYRTYVMKAWIS
jgi:hypothetical protein